MILTMEKAHEERILELAPEVKNRVFLLKEFAKIKDNNLEIQDPISRPEEFYQETFGKIGTATGAKRRWPTANFTDDTEMGYVIVTSSLIQKVNDLTVGINLILSVKSVKSG